MPDSRKRVLVVDDDTTLLELLVDTLEAVDYDAVPAAGGAEALEALSLQTFDLMITDVKMPDVDGISLLKRVRRHYPDMPVLFITGVASPEIIASAGPDGFLSKPFRISHIEELIEATLARTSNSSPSRGIKRVLVIDKDQQYRETVSEALSLGNFIPFSVPSAEQALRELDNGEFDAVIGDASLAAGDSADLYHRIRSDRPELPLILTSESDPTADERIATGAVHPDGFLRKPFAASDMIRILSEVTLSQPRGN